MTFGKFLLRVNKMAYWVKVLAFRPDDLSSVRGTYMVEGNN